MNQQQLTKTCNILRCLNNGTQFKNIRQRRSREKSENTNLFDEHKRKLSHRHKQNKNEQNRTKGTHKTTTAN